ncbi:MAG TPA: LuxR C-terminal-related transcriptional regulator [Pseudolysinimonas sp.]
MSESVVFGVPRMPLGMAPRSALLERTGTTPLTVVRGPGGGGKTVLMSQWATSAGVGGVWISVDADRRDRINFWDAVAEAARHIGVELSFNSENGGPRHGDALRSTLVQGFRGLRERFALVIDDAQEFRDPVVLDDLLEVLHTCPSIVAVVGTRAHTLLEAPREALTLDVTVIAPDQLRLSSLDVELIVGASGSAYGTTEELLEASGGNPLLLRAMLAEPSAADGSRSSAVAIVRDLLTGLFEHLGPALGVFASSTAIADDVDTALAAHLSGLEPDRVQSMLSSLESEGLLMRRDAANGPRFRYHPLVREVLRTELKRSDPDRYRRLSLVASAAAEADARFLPALSHAVDASDFIRASDVCLHGGMSLLRSPGAAAILQQVPLRYVARLPFIAIVLGLAANVRGERWRAIELLTLALGASRASRSRQRVAERVGLALVESVVLRITGRATESMTAARRMSRLLDESPAADLEEIAGQVNGFRLQGALSLFRGGALSEARIAAERAGASAHSLAQGKQEALGAASVVAAVQAIRGESREAAGTLSRIDASDYPTEQRDGYVGSLAHLASAITALEADDPDGAEHALHFLHDMPNLEHLMLFAAIRAFTTLWRGQPQIGLRILEERAATDRPRARSSLEDRQALGIARVLLHAALGQLGAAHDELGAFARDTGIHAVLEATILLLEQRPDLVLERLARVTDLPGPRLKAAADVLTACAASLGNDDDIAEAAMRRFIAAGVVDGVQSPFVVIPAAYRSQLLLIARRIGVDAEAISRLAALPAPFTATGSRVVLTSREAEVLEALRTDASQAQIAARLGVSANTVKSQTRTLYRKLGASTRAEALRAAYLQGLHEVSPERGG